MKVAYDLDASRDFTVLSRSAGARGRTTVRIRCPFCSTTFQAYVWSISGGGKKCPGCGAMHASFGKASPVVGAVGKDEHGKG